MPAKSKSQYKLMRAVAQGDIKKKGLSQSEAKEFIKDQESIKDLPKKVGTNKFKRLRKAINNG